MNAHVLAFYDYLLLAALARRDYLSVAFCADQAYHVKESGF
jgi:hypothetical protein